MSTLSQLRALRQQVQQLADPGSATHREIRAGVQAEALRLSTETFDTQRDPYGTAWAPTKAGTPPLRGLKAQMEVVPRVDGFALVNNDPVAAYQNYGTRTIPARAFVPKPGDLPKKWQTAFETVFLGVLKRNTGK